MMTLYCVIRIIIVLIVFLQTNLINPDYGYSRDNYTERNGTIGKPTQKLFPGFILGDPILGGSVGKY